MKKDWLQQLLNGILAIRDETTSCIIQHNNHEINIRILYYPWNRQCIFYTERSWTEACLWESNFIPVECLDDKRYLKVSNTNKSFPTNKICTNININILRSHHLIN